MVLSLRTMCAEPPHDNKEWEKSLLWSILTMEKRGILMRNGLLIILMKNGFVLQYANHHFHFIPLSCHNKGSFLKQNFLSLLSLEFDF